MKNIVLLPLLLLMFACQSADELISETGNNLIGIKIKFPGSDTEYAAKPTDLASENITIVIEGPLNVDLSRMKVIASIPNNARCEPSLEGYMDLSKPFEFKIVSKTGEAKAYNLSIKMNSISYDVNEILNKPGSQLTFENYANRGIGLSGDYFVVQNYKVFNYFRISDGVQAGTLSMEGLNWEGLSPADNFSLHLTSDDKGNIVTTNYAPSGGTTKLYKWRDVKAAPELVLTWKNDIQGGGIGQKIYVKGDINSDAFIYMTVANQKMFVRWKIENGNPVSSVPDKIQMNVMNHGGANTVVVPIELSENSNYFTNGKFQNAGGWPAYNHVYVSGETNSPLYSAPPIQFLGDGPALEYIEILGMKLLFAVDMNYYNWLPYFIKAAPIISNPEDVTDFEQDLVKDHISGTWRPIDVGFDGNWNTSADIKALMEPGGKSAIVAYLGANTGVIIKRVTVY